jgi:recombination protein RecA
MYGAGISRMGDILDLATDLGIVDKAGSWYSYQGDRIGQGREQSVEFLKNNLGRAGELEDRIRQHFGLAARTAAPAAPAPAAEGAEAGSTAEAASAASEGEGSGGNGSLRRRGRAASQARA